MYQIRFRLGLRPRPRWGSLQHHPKPPSWILGDPTSKGREGREREREGEGKEKREGKGGVGGEGRRKGGREGKGRGRPSGFAPPGKIS